MGEPRRIVHLNGEWLSVSAVGKRGGVCERSRWAPKGCAGSALVRGPTRPQRDAERRPVAQRALDRLGERHEAPEGAEGGRG